MYCANHDEYHMGGSYTKVYLESKKISNFKIGEEICVGSSAYKIIKILEPDVLILDNTVKRWLSDLEMYQTASNCEGHWKKNKITKVFLSKLADTYYHTFESCLINYDPNIKNPVLAASFVLNSGYVPKNKQKALKDIFTAVAFLLNAAEVIKGMEDD